MAEKGMIISFSNFGCQVYHQSDCRTEGKVEATATKVGGMYQLDQTPDRGPEQANIAEVRSPSSELWHHRLGHLNEKDMNLLKGMVTGMNIAGRNDETCIPCIQGKQSRKP
jgi:hypothetical protein